MSTLITGATGLVGTRLAKQIDSVVATSRNAESAKAKLGDSVHVVQWKSVDQPLDLSGVPKVSSVVNLMGDSIAKGRWSDAKKKSIRESRVQGTEQLVDAVLKLDPLPEVFVSASAVGYYGSRGDEELTESSSKGTGFLADVCDEWEQATSRLKEAGVRTVIVRIGIVLAREGGALAEMLTPFKLGVGGPLGNGSQYFPWVHIDDLVGIILHSINTSNVSGVLNAAAPGIVTNKQWTAALAKKLHRPALLPVPKFALRLAIGEFADSLFFSQNVKPDAALAAGYQFKFSDLESALANLID